MIDLHRGDCLRVMPRLPDQSIDLVLCDLPYGTTHAAWDQVVPLEPLWDQYRRLLKPTGAIVLTACQPFTSRLVMSNPKWFRYEWVWAKNLVSGFLDANRRPLRNHETILVFAPKLPRYFPQDVVRRRRRRTKHTGLYNSYGTDWVTTGTNFPRSIIAFPTSRVRGHPTEKPVPLLEYLIRTYSLAGETILDNCMGYGSTGIACLNTDRHFIGIERDPASYKLARQFIKGHTPIPCDSKSSQTAPASVPESATPKPAKRLTTYAR